MTRRHGPAVGQLPPEDYRGSFRRTARRVGRLAHLTRPYWRRSALSIVALLATTAAALATPWAAKQAIDLGIVPGDKQALATWVAAFAGLAALGWLAQSGQTYLTGWVGQRVLADLRSQLFEHIQRLELGYFEHQRTGRLISRLTNDIDALEQLVTDGLTSTVQNTLLLVGTAVVLLLMDWRLALATLVVFPLMAAGSAVFRYLSARAYRRMRERLADVTATIAEDIGGARVVQGFRRETRNAAAFAEVNESYRAANRRTVTLNGTYFPYVDLLSTLAMVIVLGYGGYLYFHGEILLGTLFAFVMYLSNFFDPVQQLSQLLNTFLAATAALDKIFDVMDTEPRLASRADAVELPSIAGAVDLDGVVFGYGESAPVLHGIDLHVAAGQTVALVGHTGAGKSTLVKLLARFYDPREGSIRIDGHDLRDVELASLRRQVGIVPQEGFLFAATIRENISFGRPSATLDEVRAAARAVGADRFVEQLPQGYDTMVAERGALLSIGQRQLVAFARALLADPRLLILDEATSSVDIATEGIIEEALDRLLADRTAFVVAHRLSTIRRADLIVVLEHGRVIEQGTHDELIALGGRYHALYDDWVEAVA
jgi:ABC-type multidrug transport system fused ATPase/permease subunit